jgi:acyl dehydratase
MAPELVRALLARKKAGAGVPRLEAVVERVRPAPERLARYRRVCGFEPSGLLPLTWPQVRAWPVHLALLNRPEFPYRLMGMIHVRNVIRQWLPLREGAPLSMRCWLEGEREVRHGRELDMHTEVNLGSQRAWESVTTMLRRMPGSSAGTGSSATRARPAREPSGEDVFSSSRVISWQVREDTGRRYAQASGDYNPIHLHALTARPFGFQRAIAHGMWTLARCVAELAEATEALPLTLTVDFRRPLLLPSEVRFQSARKSDTVHFRVTNREEKEHLVGRLEKGIHQG